MTTYQDLQIISPLSFQELDQAIKSTLPAGWGTGHAGESSKSGNWDESVSVYTYHCAATPAHNACTFILAKRGEGVYYVPNLFCHSQGQLSIDKYNEMLRLFYREVLGPLEVAGKINATISSPSYKIEDHLSTKAYDFLKIFAGNANKSTCRSHPSDCNYWQNFLIEVHKQTVQRPDTEMLGRWFLEEAGWAGWNDCVSELTDEYEFCLSLLSKYDSYCV